MTTHDVTELVQQGIAAYHTGDSHRAYTLLAEALRNDPRHEVGWLWMFAVVQAPAERRYCLERVVDVNPSNAAAKRGLAKFTPEIVSRSPLPAPPAVEDVARCTYPGCTEPVQRVSHTLCREHWKQRHPKPLPVPALKLLTATEIGERFKLTSKRVNLLFAEMGWIERQGPNWLPTEQGQTLGAVKRHYAETGKAYVIWPDTILEHKAVRKAFGIGDQGIDNGAVAATPEQTFRKRFPAEHRTTDGHLVRSKAEMLIDNWLYMSGVVHAYERQLPIEEEVYCDFYLPTGKVYIEYWGLENDPTYNARRQTKTDIYRRYRFRLIELTDEHIRNLDDHLPKLLLKYGIAVE